MLCQAQSIVHDDASDGVLRLTAVFLKLSGIMTQNWPSKPFTDPPSEMLCFLVCFMRFVAPTGCTQPDAQTLNACISSTTGSKTTFSKLEIKDMCFKLCLTLILVNLSSYEGFYSHFTKGTHFLGIFFLGFKKQKNEKMKTLKLVMFEGS